ncbi:membrane-bound hydrophilic protein [Streptomyces leeuwenhoekii]|uniref:Membrane-bound hydrophilic protein n=1 Tax=Streptomyces leeuwenhoekii TaxID=1437453 RepID=A0ABR5I178_STRLW|nr:membrane-bound hydrophilic protein [Streptomyces leeuwenhoekii]
MSADEVREHGATVPEQARTGPRHAAPRKPLLTRFHMPAGRAIALAAMPTAVLMGMGFTPTLALADSPSPSASNSLTAEEYEACVAALEKGGKQDGPTDPAPSPSASASASATEDAGDGRGDGGARPAPSSSGTTGAGPSASPSSQVSSPDSGSDDETGESGAGEAADQDSRAVPASSSPSPSPSPSQDGGLLEDIGARIEELVPGGASSPSAGPTPAASASSSGGAPKDPTGAAGDGAARDPEKHAADPDPSAPGGGPRNGGTAAGDAGEAGRAEAEEETADTGKADQATASPGPDPSASASADPEDCPIATDAEGGVDNALLLPDDPWYLEASSLTLKGADYQGIVEVKTASGTTKRVLKYVISGGTDIGDLHQIVKDRGSGKTYHVQAAKGSTSTIRDGKTIMYTESISGNLLGLIPVTFDPEHPPPLNIPLIYFTNVKVTQAGQFGGTLTIPGLHQTITD